jgi:hypothetical protein
MPATSQESIRSSIELNTKDKKSTLPYHKAAGSVYKALSDQGIKCCLFGGLAMILIGCTERPTKDIDFLAHATKGRVVDVLKRTPNFKFTGNMRPDLATFMCTVDKETILVEVFLSK